MASGASAVAAPPPGLGTAQKPASPSLGTVPQPLALQLRQLSRVAALPPQLVLMLQT